MYVLCCAKLLQSCLTLCDPMDCSPPGSSDHGILQTRLLKSVDCPPPGDLPDPGIEPASPALQANSLTTEPPGNVNVYHRINVNAVKNQGSQRKRMQKQIGCQI